MSDNIFAKIALGKIEEAINNGEFNNLPGQGKPVNLDYLDFIPSEMRAAYSLLRNSDALPQEAVLLKEIAVIREEIEACNQAEAEKEEVSQSAYKEKKQNLTAKLRELELKYNLAKERAARKDF